MVSEQIVDTFSDRSIYFFFIDSFSWCEVPETYRRSDNEEPKSNDELYVPDQSEYIES